MKMPMFYNYGVRLGAKVGARDVHAEGVSIILVFIVRFWFQLVIHTKLMILLRDLLSLYAD